jgi:hypothetical protein
LWAAWTAWPCWSVRTGGLEVQAALGTNGTRRLTSSIEGLVHGLAIRQRLIKGRLGFCFRTAGWRCGIRTAWSTWSIRTCLSFSGLTFSGLTGSGCNLLFSRAFAFTRLWLSAFTFCGCGSGCLLIVARLAFAIRGLLAVTFLAFALYGLAFTFYRLTFTLGGLFLIAVGILTVFGVFALTFRLPFTFGSLLGGFGIGLVFILAAFFPRRRRWRHGGPGLAI